MSTRSHPSAGRDWFCSRSGDKNWRLPLASPAISILSALYFEIARPQDRIAVKPHAGPVFHVVSYLFGRQNREKMEGLRRFGGAQPYPSRGTGRRVERVWTR